MDWLNSKRMVGSHTINWFLFSLCEHRNTVVKCTVGVILTFFPIFSHWVVKVDKGNYNPPVCVSSCISPRRSFSPKCFLFFKAYSLFSSAKNFQNQLETKFTSPQSTVKELVQKYVCLQQMFADQLMFFKYLVWFLSVNPVMAVAEQTVKTFKVLAPLFSS